jgi:hypothetical protein
MNEVQLVPLQEQDQLVTELRAVVLEMTESVVSGLKRAAMIVRQLDDMGFDYSGFPTTLIRMARSVAQGRLLPDMARLQGTLLYSYAEKVPVTTQQLILRDQSVSIIDLSNPSPENTKTIPISQLSKQEMAIVFYEHGVRNTDQQYGEWRRRQALKLPDAIPAVDDWLVDRKKKEIVISNRRYTRLQLLKMIQAIEE